MSRSPGRHKSILKTIPPVKEIPGPLLKFKWSTSAAQLLLLEENPSVMLPSIDTTRTQRKIFNDSRSMTDQSTVISHSSRSTQKSSPLPSVAKCYSRSPTLTKQEQSSPQRSPLLLNYAQLHKSSSPSPILRSRQARLSIYQIPNDKQHGMPNVNEKPLSTSKASAASITTASSIPTKVFNGLPNDNLVRLNTPQLRRLNVSEHYMNEAKKLYFNADCKIFVPYTSSTAVF